MDFQTLAAPLHTLQTAAIAVLIVAICAYFPTLNYSLQLGKLPKLDGASTGGKEHQNPLISAKKLYNEGYRKFKDSVYRMAGQDGVYTVVVPLSLLPELRKLPDDVLSFPRPSNKLTLEIKYTNHVHNEPVIGHSCRSDLTPALARLNPVICAEVDDAVKASMPPCQEWTEVCINQKLMEVVSKVSGRVFVGPEICRDPSYLDSGINYTVDFMTAIRAIKMLRPWLRPFLAARLPEVRRLREHRTKAADVLKPIIQARLEAQKTDANYQQPDDMLQWMINRSQGDTTLARMTKMQLGLIVAAVNTTSNTATDILYSLAVTPEYIQPLREEVRKAMADNDGIMTSRALLQMEKLDSYMKEVLRCYPPGVTSFSRRVLKGITLSNGQYIPPGVVIEVPSKAIYDDSIYWTDSASFDGFRHYKLRHEMKSSDKSSSNAAKNARNQFVTTNETNLGFGYGSHACPSRFFTANEIKMILAHLVLEYDIKMPDGGLTRHKQIELVRQMFPDPTKTLMFRVVAQV